jgi:hypothetical protein
MKTTRVKMIPSDLLLDGEIFLKLKEVDGYYISNKGRCWSVKKRIFRKISDNGAGYKFIQFGKNNRYYVHRLVALNFLEKPDGSDYVNHIDHDKSNNDVSNLEWVTAKENTKHGIDAGRINAKKRGVTNQLTCKDRAKCVIMRRLGFGINEIAIKLGFPRTTISSVFNNRSDGDFVKLVEDETFGMSEDRLKLALNWKETH